MQSARQSNKKVINVAREAIVDKALIKFFQKSLFLNINCNQSVSD